MESQKKIPEETMKELLEQSMNIIFGNLETTFAGTSGDISEGGILRRRNPQEEGFKGNSWRNPIKENFEVRESGDM